MPEVYMPDITMEISISRIEDSIPVNNNGRYQCHYHNSDNPFCTLPAGLFTMTIGMGLGILVTNSIIEAYKNRDIRIILVGGLFEVFSLAIFGAGMTIFAKRCATMCRNENEN